MISYRKDVIKRAGEIQKMFSEEEYEDTLDTLIKFLEYSTKHEDYASYVFNYIGELYIKIPDARANLKIRERTGVTNHQKRYENIIKEFIQEPFHMSHPYKRLVTDSLTGLDKRGFDIEYIEQQQKKVNDVSKGIFKKI